MQIEADNKRLEKKLCNIENLKKSRITDEELNSFTELDNKTAYIYYLMNKGYTYEKKIIKNSDVSEEEYAYILVSFLFYLYYS